VKGQPTPDVEWQRVWFATRQRPWGVLAIVPSDPGVEVDKVARMIVATGEVHGEKKVTLLSAMGVTLANVHAFLDKLNTLTARDELVVVPVDPLTENPSAIPILRAASTAVLVVRLGESLVESARTVIQAVGRERLVGSVVLAG
jgi:hypothetical protein